MRRLTLWLLVAAGSWAVGCGGRTGDDLPLGVGGSGTGATGAVGAMGGMGAYGGAGMGGIGAYGGAGYGGGGYGGAGMGGMGAYGGAGMGGMGAYGGAGYGGGGYGGAGMGGIGAFGGGGYGGAPTDCCYPKGTPGCVPPETAKCVCAQDSYCCTTAWDQLCVNEVDSLGCGYCGTGGFGGGGMGGMGGGGMGGGGMGGTGGGVFCANGQFCASLQIPQAPIVLAGCCPPNAPNACGLDTTPISGLVPLPAACIRKNQPGVPDSSCPSLIVSQGGALPGCCKPNGVCGNDFSPIQLGCVNTAPYNGQPSIPCGAGGAGGTGGIGGMGGVGGTGGTGGFTGSCCQMHPWPGCNDPNIYKCVCSKDMYCCNGQWDSACVSEVDSLGCGKCGGTGGAGGTGGVGGSGGTGGTCNPANCQLPPPMLGCCVSPTGPCGAVTPNGCQPF